MKIYKLGRIFEPAAHELPDGCSEFAQSPQTLLIPGGVRIYFSTRSRDADGVKFRSHVAFADFEDDLQTIRRVSKHTVLPNGKLGCFDEHGIFPINVLRVGNEVWGYTCGWNRRVSVSVDTAIGLVISRNGGETFERIGDGPVMGPELHEPFLVGDAFVLQENDTFWMWYMFGTGWQQEGDTGEPDRIYKINQASSRDGREWQRVHGRQILPDRLGADECQALPSVVYFGDRYHMVFCYRHLHGFRTDANRGYRIGYAWSRDLQTWTRDDEQLGFCGSKGSWDQHMQCYPHLFVHQDKLFLLYNGNAFGREGFGLARLEP